MHSSDDGPDVDRN